MLSYTTTFCIPNPFPMPATLNISKAKFSSVTNHLLSHCWAPAAAAPSTSSSAVDAASNNSINVADTGPVAFVWVLPIAASTRCILLLLLTLSDWLLPDHDPGDDVARFPLPPQHRTSAFGLTAFIKWDSAHYLQLATSGQYSTQQTLAFYPTFPYVVRYVALMWAWTTGAGDPIAASATVFVVAAVVVSNFSFILSALVLHDLLRRLVQQSQQHEAPLTNTEVVRTAVLCYVCNPASVFFASAYTESLFALCSFTGMWQLVLARDAGPVAVPAAAAHVVAAGISFAAASSVRSNGLFNVLFLLAFATSVLVCKRGSWRATAALLVSTAFAVLAAAAPFVVFNGHMHVLACGDFACPATSTGQEFVAAAVRLLQPLLLHLPGTAMYTSTGNVAGGSTVSAVSACCIRGPWGCSMYSAVQRDFWDVGFLRYFQWKQLPNFALACPAVAVAVFTVQEVARHMPTTSAVDKEFKSGLGPHLLLVAHLVHLMVSVFVGVFVAHVQITTRLLCSACPVFYLGLAHLLCGSGGKQRHRLYSFAVVGYLISFNILGLVLFPNFYPFT